MRTTWKRSKAMIKKYFTDLKGRTRKLYTSEAHPERSQDCITSVIDDIDRGYGYLRIDNLTLLDAYNNLTPEEFGVYLYLASNVNGYPQGYSPENIHKLLHMDIKTARKAKDNLKAKGYIVNTGEYDNDFIFHRVPVECSAQPEPVGIDRTSAELMILSTDKHVQHELRYAKSEKDFARIDETVNLTVDREFPELAEVEQTEPEQGPERPLDDIDWFTEFGRIKAEHPELVEQLEKACGAEYTRITEKMRQMVLDKYNVA